MKNHKRILTLALALVLALGLLPTGALAAMDETVAVDVQTPYDGLQSIEAFVRIDHAVSKETMTCSNGETLDVYTIYPNAKVYRLGFGECTQGEARWYAATVENGVLQVGEQEGEYIHSEPAYNFWIYIGEDEIGKYIVLDILDDHYTKRIGLHVVAGSVPAGTPATYIHEWGLSYKLTRDTPTMEVQAQSWVTEGVDGPIVDDPVETCTAYKVPAGTTLVPPPYRAGEHMWDTSAYVYRWPLGVLCNERTAEEVALFPYQGRQVAVVEPGYVYCCFNDYYYDGTGDESHFGSVESGIFLTADLDVPALEAPAIPASLAYPSPQNMDVIYKSSDNGGGWCWPEVHFDCYALKDAAGNLTNYVKLRDLAAVMSNTVAQFDVGWDGLVTLTSGTAYTPVGGEREKVFFGNQPYTPVTAQTIVNGVPVTLDAFTITDETGGGHTYYKLRDLAQALNFNVSWRNNGITIYADKPYDPND